MALNPYEKQLVERLGEMVYETVVDQLQTEWTGEELDSIGEAIAKAAEKILKKKLGA